MQLDALLKQVVHRLRHSTRADWVPHVRRRSRRFLVIAADAVFKLDFVECEMIVNEQIFHTIRIT